MYLNDVAERQRQFVAELIREGVSPCLAPPERRRERNTAAYLAPGHFSIVGQSDNRSGLETQAEFPASPRQLVIYSISKENESHA